MKNLGEKIKGVINKNNFYKTNPSGRSGISLIVLVITMIVRYDKMKKCCNM